MSITAHRRTGAGAGAKAWLPMLVPPLAALLYPFALKGFNASVTRIPEGDAGALALSSLSAAVYLALAFATPLIANRDVPFRDRPADCGAIACQARGLACRRGANLVHLRRRRSLYAT